MVTIPASAYLKFIKPKVTYQKIIARSKRKHKTEEELPGGSKILFRGELSSAGSGYFSFSKTSKNISTA